MKRPAIKFIFFLLPLLLLTVFILRRDVERSFAYHYNPGDCENRGAWLYERIFQDTTPADIVFVGSSHTMTGIWDSEIESLLYVQSHQKLHVLNLGYCRNGEELPYILLKDLLQHKKPKLVIIEARENLSLNSHPVYPYFAQNEELLSPPSYWQPAYFSNVYDGWLTHLAGLRSDLFQKPDTVQADGYSPYGFRFSEHTDDPAELDKARDKRMKPRPATLFADELKKYPLAWTEKTEAIALASGARVIYLYLPSFGSPQKTPELMQILQSEKCLFPPDSVLSDKLNWRDPDHINNRGAREIAAWIAGELAGE